MSGSEISEPGEKTDPLIQAGWNLLDAHARDAEACVADREGREGPYPNLLEIFILAVREKNVRVLLELADSEVYFPQREVIDQIFELYGLRN